MRLGQLIFRLPSATDFIGRITEDLSNGISALVLLPDTAQSEDVRMHALANLYQNGFNVVQVSLGQESAGSPSQFIASELNLAWTSAEAPRTPSNLITVEGIPDVIYLHGIGNLAPESRRPWFRFVSEWAQVSQNIADTGRRPPALCIVATLDELDFSVPITQPYLAVYWWWRFPSTLEMRLACRIVSQESGDASHLGMWRERVIPAIAGSDVELAEYLWDRITSPFDDIEDSLVEYAQRIGWDSQSDLNWDFLKQHQYDSSRINELHPPEQMLELWASGGLIYTPEYGIEIHTALLAAGGRHVDVEHRLWRGQAELLLPLADRIRLEVCENLTESYGPTWPTRWQSPHSPEEWEAVTRNPFAAQLGHIENLLRYTPQLRSKRYLINIVNKVRTIRNEITHYRSVPFAEFEELWKGLGDLQRRVGN